MNNSPPSSRQFAVVTGASWGIGFELARQFAQNGFDVLAAAEDESIHAAAGRIAGEGASVVPFQADLSSYEGVEKLVAKIRASGRPVDAIAINAGVGASGNFAQDTELKAELNLIALNVTASVHLAKRVVVDMVDRKQGKILFTSSIAGTMPTPFEAVYVASRAFLLSFAEAMRSQLRDLGVTVTALLPGATETKFFRCAGMEGTRIGVSEKDDPVDAARNGFEALMAGKDKGIAGSFTSRVLPETAKANIDRTMAEPGPARK